MPGDEANRWVVYGLLLAAGVTGGLGDLWIYHWATSGKAWWLMTSCVVWLASLLCFGLILRWDTRAFGAAFMLTSVFHIVLVVACDRLYYGGRVSTLEWVGMGFALVAVVLLELGKNSPTPAEPAPLAVAVSESLAVEGRTPP